MSTAQDLRPPGGKALPRTNGRGTRVPAPGELALAILVLFVLARTPVLFFRERAIDAFGGTMTIPWPDDAVIRGVFLLAEAMVIVVAIRVCRLSALVRLWPLLPFLGFALLSTAWSVEPGVTWRRACMFAATALVGWYLGERFPPRHQAFAVAGAGAAATAATLVALIAWPDISRMTEGYAGGGLWSGAYVHRNFLGLAMATGLLGLAFVLPRLRGAALAAGSALGLVELYLYWRSGSRTGLVALAVVVAVSGLVAALRSLRRLGVTARGGAVATAVATTFGGYVVHRNWPKILSLIGRDVSLSSRARIWEVVRQFVDRRPTAGWGYEAFWAHPAAVQEATASFYFAHAHSGYYEFLLGVGKIGFALFLLAVAVTAWRVFLCAWSDTGLESLWPLALAVFVVAINFSESFWSPNDVQWALFVCAGVGARRTLVDRDR